MIDLSTQERALVTALAAGGPTGTAVEALLDGLLSTLPALSARCTDGVAVLREERGPSDYFCVALVYMVSDQSRQPAFLRLSLEATGRVAEGQLLFGATSARAPFAGSKRDRLENALLAYPLEAVESLAWSHEFRRSAVGWAHEARAQLERT